MKLISYDTRAVIYEAAAASKRALVARAAKAGVDMAHALLGGTNLRNVNLDGAQLRNAYLGDANLSGTSLMGANLRGAFLQRANLTGVRLEGANLIDISVDKKYQPVVQIKGAEQWLTMLGAGHVQIGCHQHPLDYWLEHYRAIGRMEGYCEDAIQEYRLYLDLLRDRAAQHAVEQTRWYNMGMDPASILD